MNSKGHLYISLGKSAIRIIGGIVAEIGGVLEELVDER